MDSWNSFAAWLYTRPMLFILFISNALGTIYGYYWYKDQLTATPWYWIPFVPDSPTASLFFSLVLFLYLIHRSGPLLEAFAAVTLFKYGIWAVSAIIGAAWLEEPSMQFLKVIHPLNWMLVFSHSAMALEALLFRQYYTFHYRHLFVVAIWTLSNDFLDYVFLIHPWVGESLNPYIPYLGLFTLGLSIVSLGLFAVIISKKVGS